MSRPTGYSVNSYGRMIVCEPRMSAYDAAIRAAVSPGCSVIDIGAGTGIFSLLACKYGAGSVTAIEPADEVMLLRETAEANGWADRVEVFQGLSTAFEPRQKADVIVSDIRGIIPLFEHHIETIRDARDRLLAPGGALIPMRDTIRVALACAPEAIKIITEPWLHNGYGLDLTPGHRYSANSQCKVFLEPEALVSDVKDLAVLDYRTIDDPNMTGKVTLTPNGDVTAHGILMWFDAELAPGIGFSNAPGEPELVYGQSLLPFERPLSLTAADQVEAEIKANLVDVSYVWTWATRVFRGSGARPEIAMHQSTFKGQVFSPEKLARRANSHVPAPKRAYDMDARALSLLDGKRNLGEIAELLRSEYPTALPTPKAALDHVASLVERYSLETD